MITKLIDLFTAVSFAFSLILGLAALLKWLASFV